MWEAEHESLIYTQRYSSLLVDYYALRNFNRDTLPTIPG